MKAENSANARGDEKGKLNFLNDNVGETKSGKKDSLIEKTFSVNFTLDRPLLAVGGRMSNGEKLII